MAFASSECARFRRLGYFRTVEAALAPDDLVYAYDLAKPPYGRIVVVPLRELRFR